jgi:hypothetical protein
MNIDIKGKVIHNIQRHNSHMYDTPRYNQLKIIGILYIPLIYTKWWRPDLEKNPILFYSILQVAVNIRLYEYWHEQVKIRKKRWNNKPRDGAKVCWNCNKTSSCPMQENNMCVIK